MITSNENTTTKRRKITIMNKLIYWQPKNKQWWWNKVARQANLHTDRVRQLAYVAHVHIPTAISVCMILDMCMLTRALIFSLWFFKVLKIFMALITLCLKTWQSRDWQRWDGSFKSLNFQQILSLYLSKQR